jgi:outer membrane lipoprotein-sorting protein
LKRHLTYFIILMILASVISAYAENRELSGEDIIKRVDKNKIYETIEYNGKMTIKKGRRTRVKIMRVYAEGEEKALIEFTNPVDRGTKYLKLHDEMWIYFPDAEEIIKISGHMLKQSMMGSDFSYEDVMENEGLLERYQISVLGSEIVDERDCYVLELNAKSKEVTYAKQKLWVDKERFVILKTELYALSGKLLKEILMEKVQKYGDRYFATKMTMNNKVIRDSSTIFEMESIDFGVELPENIFSKRRLER